MPKALIFDLDGTILNTLDDIGNACNFALRHFGYPPHPLKAYEQMVGNGFIVLVMRALPQGLAESMPQEDFTNILNVAKNHYAEHMCERTEPYGDLPSVLKTLADASIRLCVLSNKPEPMTQALVAHYYPNVPFFRVLGGRPDFPLKPDPSRLLSLLDELGLSPADTLFVGDSNVDMQTAHAAGMEAIGVAWGFRGARELLNHGASKLIESPAELLTLLDKPKEN
ncbi:MAG: HAD family hydrolase [Desulfovibrionaceae bacterium]|nr:HAD family hydrolase [Desulfovibrionaceae bacterium]